MVVSSYAQNSGSQGAASQKKVALKKDNVTKAVLTAKDYVASNAFINVRFQEPLDLKNVAPADSVKLKAAIYRFYKNVQLEGGIYICYLKNGKKINISEKIFNSFLTSLKETNIQIEELRAKGEKVDLSPITEAYLQSMLE